jgi:ParB family chromosome partitioning protein
MKNKLDYSLIKSDFLKVSSFNIRTITTTELKEEMEDLKQSIKSKGIIEPLIVRKSKNEYEVVVGQRRFLAGKKVGLKEFPCIVKELSDQEAIEYSLIENLQRKDIDPLDVAEALKKLYDMMVHREPKLSIRQFAIEIGKQLGLSGSEVERYLSLTSLAPKVKEMVSTGNIGVKIASQLAPIEKEKQEKVAKLLTETSTEDQAEELIKKVKGGEEPKEALEEVVVPNEMKVVIFVKDEKIDFRLPFRYWKILSSISDKTKKTFSELIREALDLYLKEVGYGKNP